MSGAILAGLVGLALAILVVRRRTVAIALVSLQTLLLVAGAISVAHGHAEGVILPVAVLLVRALTLPAVLLWIRARTPERRLVSPARPAAARLTIGIVIASVAAASMPPLGLGDRGAEIAAVALVAIGMTIVVTRRPSLFQIIGLLVAENGVYLLAVSVPGGVPPVIELGVLFDVALVVTVAAGFSYRIHREVGTTDTELLRGLRD